MIFETVLGILLGGLLLVILLPLLGLLISIGIISALVIAILLGGTYFFSNFYWDFLYAEPQNIVIAILIFICGIGIIFSISECRKSKDWRIKSIPATIYLLTALYCIVGIAVGTKGEINLLAFLFPGIFCLIPCTLYGLWLRYLYKRKDKTVTSV